MSRRPSARRASRSRGDSTSMACTTGASRHRELSSASTCSRASSNWGWGGRFGGADAQLLHRQRQRPGRERDSAYGHRPSEEGRQPLLGLALDQRWNGQPGQGPQAQDKGSSQKQAPPPALAQGGTGRIDGHRVILPQSQQAGNPRACGTIAGLRTRAWLPLERNIPVAGHRVVEAGAQRGSSAARALAASDAAGSADDPLATRSGLAGRPAVSARDVARRVQRSGRMAAGRASVPAASPDSRARDRIAAQRRQACGRGDRRARRRSRGARAGVRRGQPVAPGRWSACATACG